MLATAGAGAGEVARGATAVIRGSYPSPEGGGWRAKRAGWGSGKWQEPHPAAAFGRDDPPRCAGRDEASARLVAAFGALRPAGRLVDIILRLLLQQRTNDVL